MLNFRLPVSQHLKLEGTDYELKFLCGVQIKKKGILLENLLKSIKCILVLYCNSS